MTRLFSSLVALLLLLASASRAAELTDLGQGLGYLRIHSAADSAQTLRSAVHGAGAIVLDLRQATADAASAEALRAGLAGHSTSAPVFVLVGPDTPAVLTVVLAPAPAGVFTLGPAGTQPAPGIAVKTEVATDREAFAALDTGTPVATLIDGKVEKERFDEAALMDEFKNGNPDPEPLPGAQPGQTPAGQQAGTVPPAGDSTEANADDAKAKPAPLVDRVLQRAVHLHRALLALRK